MRVFVGIELNDSVKESLFDVQQQLKTYSTKGNFTALDNFHLTLQFIGEVTETELETLKSVVSSAAGESNSFDVSLNQVGEFPKKNKSILWAGTESTLQLTELYDNLHDAFSQNNLKIEKKAYTPHITLGRNSVLKENLDQVRGELRWEAISVKIDNITLFESVRIKDKLVYRALEKCELNK